MAVGNATHVVLVDGSCDNHIGNNLEEAKLNITRSTLPIGRVKIPGQPSDYRRDA